MMKIKAKTRIRIKTKIKADTQDRVCASHIYKETTMHLNPESRARPRSKAEAARVCKSKTVNKVNPALLAQPGSRHHCDG